MQYAGPTDFAVTIASAVRLASFAVPALGCLALLGLTGDLLLFGSALVATLVFGVVVEHVYQEMATTEEQRRDLEDRVRNPPS